MHGKRFGRMRPRAILVGVLWFAGAGLATAVWATQDGDGERANPSALARAIKMQMIRNGVRVAAASADEHQARSLTPVQMISLAGKYETELDTLVTHAEQLRINVYHSHDIIRLAFIDDRMAQLRSVIRIAKPYFEAFHAASSTADSMSLRTQFMLVQQAIDRARELVSEMEKSMGEDMDNITATQVPADLPRDNDVTEPTRPQDPNAIVDRPPEASTYR